MSRLESAALLAIQRVTGGRAITFVARTGMPIVGAKRLAERRPSPKLSFAPASPLVEPYDAPAVTPGVLDGDVIVKDQIDVAGLRTGIGMADGGDRADHDAAIVARVRVAGGRIIGKAKMTELGIDGLGTLMPYAIPGNPRAPGYLPGGSSTGTAVAVASGLARYGIGGDGLGSIRIPAAFCGLVGLKPSRERLPREGIRTPVRTLDAVGPIARTVEDCAALWQVMAGDPVTRLEPLVPSRIGVPLGESHQRLARSVATAFRRALAALGSEVADVTLGGIDTVTFLGGMTGAHELATGPYAGRESSYGARRTFGLGRAIGPLDYARLQDQRKRLRDDTLRLLARVPILALPTTAVPPPALTKALLAGRSAVMMLRAVGAFTPLANLCDLPSIAVPAGVDAVGRPLSIMFVAAPGEELMLLRVALAVERTGVSTLPIDTL
jgi:aspartyl-tRNA(Asn)/glutamyl-tRNA(Gln) amidotransferase subunit A